jgi:hypothetical protein
MSSLGLAWLWDGVVFAVRRLSYASCIARRMHYNSPSLLCEMSLVCYSWMYQYVIIISTASRLRREGFSEYGHENTATYVAWQSEHASFSSIPVLYLKTSVSILLAKLSCMIHSTVYFVELDSEAGSGKLGAISLERGRYSLAGIVTTLGMRCLSHTLNVCRIMSNHIPNKRSRSPTPKWNTTASTVSTASTFSTNSQMPGVGIDNHGETATNASTARSKSGRVKDTKSRSTGLTSVSCYVHLVIRKVGSSNLNWEVITVPKDDNAHPCSPLSDPAVWARVGFRSL